jgi:hypothetical protein
MFGSDSGTEPPHTQQATEAIEQLLLWIDQASRAMRDLTPVGGHWAEDPQERARDIAKDSAAKASVPSAQSHSRSSTTL